MAGFTASQQSDVSVEVFVLCSTQCRAVCPAEPGHAMWRMPALHRSCDAGAWAAQAHCHCQHSPVPTSLWSPAPQSELKQERAVYHSFIALIVTNVRSLKLISVCFAAGTNCPLACRGEVLMCNTFQTETSHNLNGSIRKIDRLFCKAVPTVAGESAFPGMMVTISVQD